MTGLPGLTCSIRLRYSWTPGMLARERMQHEYALASDCTPAMSAPRESSSAVPDDTEAAARESTGVRDCVSSVTPCGTDLPVPAASSHE